MSEKNIVLLIYSFLFISFSFKLIQFIWVYIKSSVKTIGEIIEIRKNQFDGNMTHNYEFILRYSYNGEELTSSVFVFWGKFYKPGDLLPIKLNPRRPNTIYFHGKRFIFFYVESLIGVMFIIYFILNIIRLLK